MFFHIFKALFIIDSHIPSIIKSCYTINKIEDQSILDDPDKTLEYLAEKANRDSIVFYDVGKYLNPIIMRYCFFMGLDYKSYSLMVSHNKAYQDICVRTYEPRYEDHYIPIPEKKFYVVGQSIPWNYGLIPIEYWINHFSYDVYPSMMYQNMYKKLIEYNDYLESTDHNKEIEPKSTVKMITDPNYNMCFNSEFNMFYFNKPLMNYFINKKFFLRTVPCKYNEDDMDVYEDYKIKRKKLYDQPQIYNDI